MQKQLFGMVLLVLEILEGGGTGDGSISQQIASLKAELEGKIAENKTAIETEEQRATQAEGQLATDLSELIASTSYSNLNLATKKGPRSLVES